MTEMSTSSFSRLIGSIIKFSFPKPKVQFIVRWGKKNKKMSKVVTKFATSLFAEKKEWELDSGMTVPGFGKKISTLPWIEGGEKTCHFCLTFSWLPQNKSDQLITMSWIITWNKNLKWNYKKSKKRSAVIEESECAKRQTQQARREIYQNKQGAHVEYRTRDRTDCKQKKKLLLLLLSIIVLVSDPI